MATPVNAGAPWTVKDDQALLASLATHSTIPEIALQFGRTPGAISARQNHLARVLVREEGQTIEKTALILRKSPAEIEQALSRSPIKKFEKRPNHVAGNSADESLLRIAVEIRDLLRELVALARD